MEKQDAKSQTENKVRATNVSDEAVEEDRVKGSNWDKAHVKMTEVGNRRNVTGHVQQIFKIRCEWSKEKRETYVEDGVRRHIKRYA